MLILGKRSLIGVTLCILSFGVIDAGAQKAQAQVSPQKQEKWESLTPEQKEQIKKKADGRQKMTREEKKAAKQEKWESLTPEQKEQIKKQP
jgi:hypothetical protein